MSLWLMKNIDPSSCNHRLSKDSRYHHAPYLEPKVRIQQPRSGGKTNYARQFAGNLVTLPRGLGGDLPRWLRNSGEGFGREGEADRDDRIVGRRRRGLGKMEAGCTISGGFLRQDLLLRQCGLLLRRRCLPRRSCSLCLSWKIRR